MAQTPPTPPFLELLGIGIDADERTIRRAYAKKIKQIDAELQAQAFQAMHEAYEHAMAWAKWQAGIRAFEAEQDGQAAEDAPPAATRPGLPQEDLAARADGHAVFAEFLAGFQCGGTAVPDATALTNALRAKLEDGRLIDLETRTAFEHALAVYLAAGWKHGNDVLFTVAIDIFQWDHGRNGLEHAGAGGMRLNRAIMEWEVLQRRHAQGSHREMALLERMRDGTPPSHEEWTDFGDLLPRMAIQFAALMPIATNMANRAGWRSPPPSPAPVLSAPVYTAADRPPATPPPYLGDAANAHLKPAPRRSRWPVVGAVLAPFLFILFVAFSLSSRMSDDSRQLPAERRTTPVVIPITLPNPGDQGFHPNLQSDQAAELTAMIKPNIVFNKSRLSPQNRLAQVRFLISVDAHGLPTATVLESSSGSQEFDTAVGHAIAFSGPYPGRLLSPGVPVLYAVGPQQL